MQSASDKEDAFAAERQNYLCVFKNTKFGTQERQPVVLLYESFYVHGYEIQRLLAVDGVPLSPEQKQAEEARVQTLVVAYGNKPSAPFVGLAGGMYIARGEHRWAQTVEGAIGRAGIFSNERRVMYRGRPAIQMDFVGNRKFRAHTDEERIAKVMSGTILVDEESTAIVRVGAEAMGDVMHDEKILIGHGAHIGFDAEKVADNLYLPSSWVSFRMVNNPRSFPQFYPETEDFWLQGCRRYANQTETLSSVTPAQ
jgi:hypothetical protein